MFELKDMLYICSLIATVGMGAGGVLMVQRNITGKVLPRLFNRMDEFEKKLNGFELKCANTKHVDEEYIKAEIKDRIGISQDKICAEIIHMKEQFGEIKLHCSQSQKAGKLYSEVFQFMLLNPGKENRVLSEKLRGIDE